MDDMLITEYDGCGRCLVGARRLSRKTDKTNSPERQGNQILGATDDVSEHIIAWGDDWEVSGATDPLTRPGLGPWLRGEMGPYDGIVSVSVDRVGRNVRDTLNTQALLTGPRPSLNSAPSSPTATSRTTGASTSAVSMNASTTRNTATAKSSQRNQLTPVEPHPTKSTGAA
jgi:hypothetical protein